MWKRWVGGGGAFWVVPCEDKGREGRWWDVEKVRSFLLSLSKETNWFPRQRRAAVGLVKKKTQCAMDE